MSNEDEILFHLQQQAIKHEIVLKGNKENEGVKYNLQLGRVYEVEKVRDLKQQNIAEIEDGVRMET